MGYWYITEYDSDGSRTTTRTCLDEDLGSRLISMGICHFGRTTRAASKYEEPVAQIIHLDNGNWLDVHKVGPAWPTLGEDAKWASTCPKRVWDSVERRFTC